MLLQTSLDARINLKNSDQFLMMAEVFWQLKPLQLFVFQE